MSAKLNFTTWVKKSKQVKERVKLKMMHAHAVAPGGSTVVRPQGVAV